MPLMGWSWVRIRQERIWGHLSKCRCWFLLSFGAFQPVYELRIQADHPSFDEGPWKSLARPLRCIRMNSSMSSCLLIITMSTVWPVRMRVSRCCQSLTWIPNEAVEDYTLNLELESNGILSWINYSPSLRRAWFTVPLLMPRRLRMLPAWLLYRQRQTMLKKVIKGSDYSWSGARKRH